MNRRDFLLAWTPDAQKVATLSCERLFMLYVDQQLADELAEDARQSSGESTEGEPPAVFARRSREDLFRDLARELESVSAVRVTDASWLGPQELERELRAVLDAFAARGGTVEFA